MLTIDSKTHTADESKAVSFRRKAIGSCIVVCCAILIAQGAAIAGSITSSGTFNWVDNWCPSVFGPSGVFINFGGDFAPAVGTIVSATQGTSTFNVPYINSPADPNQFSTHVPYSPSFTGSWTLTASNETTSPTSLVVNTNAIPSSIGGDSPLILPPITNVQTNGLSTTPTFTWTQPAYQPPSGMNAGTLILILDASAGFSLVGFAALGSDATSYTVPPVFDGSSNGMIAGHNYLISVQTALYNGTPSMDTAVDTTRSFFNFTPSTTPVSFSQPINLPVETSGGGFTFSLDVTRGVPVLLDPAIAIGYVFDTGAGNPNFASVEFPDLGTFSYQLYLWSNDNWVLDAMVPALTEHQFQTGGVNKFEVLGIPDYLALNPNDPTAFVTKVTFTGDGTFTGTMMPITTTVPEPTSIALLGLGLVVGAAFARGSRHGVR